MAEQEQTAVLSSNTAPHIATNGTTGGAANKNDTIFIRENTALPAESSIQSETFVPGWRVVTNFDRSTLAASIEAAKWYFFYLAGEMKATVFGTNTPATVRRAVRVILSKQTKREFNSLEVTKVLPTRFWGIPFLSVTANSRHIQERMSLNSVDEHGLTMAHVGYRPAVAR
jgi:hypothetical protein